MNEQERKVRKLKFWRLELSAALEKQNETSAAAKIIYALYMLSGNVILTSEYAFGNSKKALLLMKKELDELVKSEAFEVYSKLNHSLQDPVADEKTMENISILYKVIHYLTDTQDVK